MRRRFWPALLFLLWAAPATAQTNNLLSAEALTQISPHVWMIKGNPNIGIVVGATGTLVVDNGMGTRNGEIIAQVARKLSAPGAKLYLTTTHYHAEHATGDGGFPAGTVLIRPRVQQEELEREAQPLIELFRSRSEENRALLKDYRNNKPDILFDRGYDLDLGGGVTVNLVWFGPAHTRGDELVMVEPDSVLISGDVVQNKTGPFFYCDTCTPRSWLAVLEEVEKLYPKIVVPDHSPPGDGTLIQDEKTFMQELASRSAALRAEGRNAADAGRIIAAEMQVKYPGWSNMARVAQGVERAYAEGR